ncbi:hypothetical protein [Variovorax sp. J31P207]|uniref:hypothetical protein n=1 Tax=Variovorax sp. J31P207 TaxID=3053510 RepID=UPI002577B5A9|nr:hypothetical protein [Variovorax sp. J31P207]MDM0067059.1 hypothetical protein [Variovorax sp. J31P207]
MGFLAKVDRDEGEPTSPEPATRDPLELLAREAVRVGLIREGDKPDQMLVDFWMSAIDAGAAVADRFLNPEHDEHTIGDDI